MPEPNNAVAQTPDEIEAAANEAAAATAANAGAQPGAADNKDELFTEEIDLGNGETLTFEAATQEELREKIFEGYRKALAASKQGAAPGAAAVAQPGAAAGKEGAQAGVPVPQKKGRKLTADEEFAIETEFKTGKPIAAFRRWIETEYGMTVDELAESAREGGAVARTTQRFEREKTAVAAFREKHPEYPPMTDKSVDLVRRYLDSSGKEASVETLEAAYAHLGELLVPAKGAPAGAGATAQPGAAATGATAAAATTTVKKPAASGLFGKTGAAARTAATGTKKIPTDAEMQKVAKEQGSGALLEMLEEANRA
jgi:hypothetical protein